jgi:protein required for attachment to host cells
MKPTITWIVVADGTTATVFEHSRPGTLQPVPGLRFEEEALKARDISADRPGRSFSSASPRRSAMSEPTDPVALNERRFVERLAERLEQERQKGRFERLVIAAAPAALGDMRPALSKQLRDTVIAELPKDLTNTPIPDLGKHFAEVLPV